MKAVLLAHRRSWLTTTPSSLVSGMHSNWEPSEKWSSGGKSHFLDLVKLITLVFCVLMTILFSATNCSVSLRKNWRRLFSSGRMCPVLSWKLRGLALCTGSGTRQALRSTLTATVPSSTNFTFSALAFVTGP